MGGGIAEKGPPPEKKKNYSLRGKLTRFFFFYLPVCVADFLRFLRFRRFRFKTPSKPLVLATFFCSLAFFVFFSCFPWFFVFFFFCSFRGALDFLGVVFLSSVALPAGGRHMVRKSPCFEAFFFALRCFCFFCSVLVFALRFSAVTGFEFCFWPFFVFVLCFGSQNPFVLTLFFCVSFFFVFSVPFLCLLLVVGRPCVRILCFAVFFFALCFGI